MAGLGSDPSDQPADGPWSGLDCAEEMDLLFRERGRRAERAPACLPRSDLLAAQRRVFEQRLRIQQLRNEMQRAAEVAAEKQRQLCHTREAFQRQGPK